MGWTSSWMNPRKSSSSHHNSSTHRGFWNLLMPIRWNTLTRTLFTTAWIITGYNCSQCVIIIHWRWLTAGHNFCDDFWVSTINCSTYCPPVVEMGNSLSWFMIILSMALLLVSYKSKSAWSEYTHASWHESAINAFQYKPERRSLMHYNLGLVLKYSGYIQMYYTHFHLTLIHSIRAHLSLLSRALITVTHRITPNVTVMRCDSNEEIAINLVVRNDTAGYWKRKTWFFIRNNTSNTRSSHSAAILHS